MATTSQSPEGGRETFYLLLVGKPITRFCCNKPNFYSLIDYNNHPPPPGSQINYYVWKKFTTDVIMNWWDYPRKINILLYSNLALFVTVYVFMGILDNEQADYNNNPIEISIFISIVSLWHISFFWMVIWGIRLSRDHSKKVIFEMKDLFKAEGYHIEYATFYMRSYARFTPLSREQLVVHNVETRDNNDYEDEDDKMFRRADWEPLIGTWERHDVKVERVLLWKRIHEFEDKEEFQFVTKQKQDYDIDLDEDDQNPDNVVLENNSMSRKSCRGRFNKTIFQTGKTKRNILERKIVRVYNNKLNKDVAIPPGADGKTFKVVPLARSSYDHGASCYKWGDRAAAYVQDNIMVIVKFPYSMPSKSELIISDISLLTSEIRYTRTSRTTSIETAASIDTTNSSGFELVWTRISLLTSEIRYTRTNRTTSIETAASIDTTNSSGFELV